MKYREFQDIKTQQLLTPLSVTVCTEHPLEDLCNGEVFVVCDSPDKGYSASSGRSSRRVVVLSNF